MGLRNGVGEMSACACGWRWELSMHVVGAGSLARCFDHKGGGFGESGAVLMLQNY